MQGLLFDLVHPLACVVLGGLDLQLALLAGGGKEPSDAVGLVRAFHALYEECVIRPLSTDAARLRGSSRAAIATARFSLDVVQ